MRRTIVVGLLLMAAAIGPASAQQAQRGGVRTETQTRLAGEDQGNDVIWNLVGLLGLLGLIGLLPQHEEDSYHPSAFDE